MDAEAKFIVREVAKMILICPDWENGYGLTCADYEKMGIVWTGRCFSGETARLGRSIVIAVPVGAVLLQVAVKLQRPTAQKLRLLAAGQHCNALTPNAGVTASISHARVSRNGGTVRMGG